VTVANATGNKRYTLSPDCPPSGTAVGTLSIELGLTTGTSTLSGSRPCPGQTQDVSPNCGTCNSACTGSACATMTTGGQCVDIKGGLSQTCCANNPQLPCFPTANGGEIVRTGSAAPPTPAFPDPTYPKTTDVTLVAAFCERSTGSSTVDTVTGLPGPGAIILPMAGSFMQ
jgi:hypothetical protein